MKSLITVVPILIVASAGLMAAAAEMSPLETDHLHDIELPASGEFRLLVDGRAFSGTVTDQSGLGPVCRADEDYHPSNHVKTFQFAQTIALEDGRAMRLEMSRMLSRSEGSWNRFMGHENDQVVLTLLPDARSRLSVRRVRPGEASYRVAEAGSANAGPYELPMVRVVRGEQLAATAVGELRALDEHPDALTGPFELAVICP